MFSNNFVTAVKEERKNLLERVAAMDKLLGDLEAKPSTTPVRRQMSAESRQRIADAQKKRWALARKSKPKK